MLNSVKTRRIPNAFMLYVKEQKKELMKNYTSENVIGEYLGKKWRTLEVEEKKVYYDRYNALKRLESNKLGFTVEANQEFESRSVAQSTSMDVSNLHPDITNIPDLRAEEASTSKNSTVKQTVDFGCDSKEKPKKKVRRPANPYMIFAKEHRKNIHSSYLKDKKCHLSTILGNMWKVLPEAEKKLYIEKAKKMHNLRKKSETASSFEATKKKIKLDSKPKPKKPGRPRRLKKIPESVAATNITMNQDTMNQSAPDASASGSVPPSSLSFQDALTSHNSHNRASQHDSHQSKCYCWNSSHHLPGVYNSLNNMTPFAAMPKHAGAGMTPSMFMPYAFPPLWMYPQMAYQMYLQSLSHPYSWGLPQDYYENSYFSSYCSGRGTGSFNLHQPTSSVSAGEPGNRNESVATPYEEENSEQELVIVDEDDADGHLENA